MAPDFWVHSLLWSSFCQDLAGVPNLYQLQAQERGKMMDFLFCFFKIVRFVYPSSIPLTLHSYSPSPVSLLFPTFLLFSLLFSQSHFLVSSSLPLLPLFLWPPQPFKMWNFLIIIGIFLLIDTFYMSLWTGLYRFRWSEMSQEVSQNALGITITKIVAEHSTT